MTTPSRRTIAYLLRTWRRCADRMADYDKENLKMLYSGLKELDKEEYKFLWDKYYLSTRTVPTSDKVMAEKYGLTLQQYRNKRNDITNKLQKLIKEDDQPLSGKYLPNKQPLLSDIRTEIIMDNIAAYQAQENTDIK